MWLIIITVILIAVIYCIEYRSDIERIYYKIKRSRHRKPLVYIAHPLGNYGNFEENVKEAEEILYSCIKCFPEYDFISPVTSYSSMYYKMSYDEGMQMCLNLLSRCSEMWMSGQYMKSKGCGIERTYAKENGIKVKIVGMKG